MNKLLHQETAEALNELLTLTFQENSFADNCAYNLSVMFMMVQVEEIFHEHYAHVFPKWADKISHCLISLGGFPHRGALTINDKVYGDLVDMFEEIQNKLMDYRNKIYEVIEIAELHNDREVVSFLDELLKELLPYVRQTFIWTTKANKFGQDLEGFDEDFEDFTNI